MCGIVGIIAKNQGNFSGYHTDIFKELLFANEVRGAHGTGMFWDNGLTCKNLKAPMPSSFFIHDAKVKDALNEIYQKSTFAIGHNRHATKGGTDMESTHPFRVGHITLIHNGTLVRHKYMKDVPVDSEAITHSIKEIGAEETLKGLDGAFALVWYDNISGTLNFIRNEERPLYLVDTANAWILSSEVKLAEWIISRNKSYVNSSEIIPVGILHSYDTITRKITTAKVDIRPKVDYWSDWKASGGSGTYKYYPPAKVTTVEKAKHEKETPLLVQSKTKTVDSFAYNLNQRIVFSPVQVVEAGRVFYLEGIIEDERKECLEVRFYDADKKKLLSLMKETLLDGLIIQVYMRKGEERYVIRDVKHILKPMDLALASVN